MARDGGGDVRTQARTDFGRYLRLSDRKALSAIQRYLPKSVRPEPDIRPLHPSPCTRDLPCHYNAFQRAKRIVGTNGELVKRKYERWIALEG